MVAGSIPGRRDTSRQCGQPRREGEPRKNSRLPPALSPSRSWDIVGLAPAGPVPWARLRLLPILVIGGRIQTAMMLS